ncbi:MAG: hypothetical protein IKC63_04405 [Clostridia bacterium]|nr:hypothetical protein [Clostridia bacterium]
MIAAYDKLSKLVKIILQLFLGAFISPLYRIIRYFDSKNIITLIVGILCCFGVGFIFWWIDLITIILNNKISVLAD